MKRVIQILVALILSLVIAFVLPNFITSADNFDNDHINEVSLVHQEVLGKRDDNKIYHKLYFKGELVGVINDYWYFNDLIEQEYKNYEEQFPNSSLGLTQDVYITEDISNLIFEDIDEELVQFLANPENKGLGVKTTAVEFSTNEGTYEIIYVISEELFLEARNEFLLNFVSEDTITKLNSNETINSPMDYGTIETNLTVQEKITFTEAIASPEDIMNNVNDIYQFLCYGRETERQYYETKEGDTVQAVGYYFGDMTAKQVKMLNPDVLSDEDQVLQPGTKLNVTYYTSPITVQVTKERLAQEVVLPESPLYVEDDTLKKGTRIIEREEVNGLRNVLYEEEWTNGVIQSGSELSSNVITEPIQGIIRVGTKQPPDVGTGNWGWPVANPIITCDYTCYAGHGGVDFQNMYNHWGEVLAVDSGVVEAAGYTSIGGYYCRVNHNNGYITYYGHMREHPYVSVGDIVDRGDVLGPIGMTGVATGPHVHFAMYRNDALINACTVLSCSLVPRG